MRPRGEWILILLRFSLRSITCELGQNQAKEPLEYCPHLFWRVFLFTFWEYANNEMMMMHSFCAHLTASTGTAQFTGEGIVLSQFKHVSRINEFVSADWCLVFGPPLFFSKLKFYFSEALNSATVLISKFRKQIIWNSVNSHNISWRKLSSLLHPTFKASGPTGLGLAIKTINNFLKYLLLQVFMDLRQFMSILCNTRRNHLLLHFHSSRLCQREWSTAMVLSVPS